MHTLCCGLLRCGYLRIAHYNDFLENFQFLEMGHFILEASITLLKSEVHGITCLKGYSTSDGPLGDA